MQGYKRDAPDCTAGPGAVRGDQTVGRGAAEKGAEQQAEWRGGGSYPRRG